MSPLFSLPDSKKRQSLLKHIEDSEEVEFRYESTIKALNDIGNFDGSKLKQTELDQQKLYTASLQKQLSELK